MKFTIEVASVSDREDLVAEIWWGSEMIAELHHGASGGVEIDIYPAESRKPWTFDFASWLEALEEARRKLG